MKILYAISAMPCIALYLAIVVLLMLLGGIACSIVSLTAFAAQTWYRQCLDAAERMRDDG